MNIVFCNKSFLFFLALERMNKKLQVFDQLVICSEIICSCGLKLLLNIRQRFLSNHFFIFSATLALPLPAKNSIFKFIWLSPYSVFNFDDHKEKRLRVGLSHLHEHKFKYSFQNCLSQFTVVI